MQELASIHAEEAEKNFREIISGKTEPFEKFNFEEAMEDISHNNFSLSEKD